ncbi:MAG: prepilin-type N-terminal cleavage/methylation domain-containing protein [Armatimonadetes bacterium]|nr:prepilin-type N-terminal cleavage/methylation domain-containing protein [Armatimonadota bacterium]
MSRGNSQRGWTLIELLIASTVAMLLLTMVVWFLVPAMRFSIEGTAKVELQESAVMALNKMIADLQLSPASGISISTDPPAVAINRIEQIDANGSPQYEDKLRVYWYDSGRQQLTLEEYPPDPPGLGLTFVAGRPTKITSLDLQQIAQQTNNQERFLAGNVQSFSVTQQAGVIILVLQMDKEIPHTERRAQVTLSRRIHLRNS